MNRFGLIAVIVFTFIELRIGEIIICGIPLWIIGLITFSFVWMGIICVKDKVEIKDSY